jgi:hypothetical protein
MARCREGEELRAAVLVEADVGGVDDGVAGEAREGVGLPDPLRATTVLRSTSSTHLSLSNSWVMPVRVQDVSGCGRPGLD